MYLKVLIRIEFILHFPAQFVPLLPGKQVHIYEQVAFKVVHIPLFWQGDGMQGSPEHVAKCKIKINEKCCH